MIKDSNIDKHYLDVNAKLLRFGWKYFGNISNDQYLINYYRDFNHESRISIYIKEQFRGKGAIKQFFDQKFITLPECNLESFFIKNKLDYICCVDGCESAYSLISEEYKNKFSNRGKIPYINHIYQGLGILKLLNSDLDTKKAFCYHPIIQSGKTLDVNDYAVTLANDYSKIANKFLRSEYKKYDLYDIKELQGELVYQSEVREMLIADKIQNYHSFMKNRMFFAEKDDIKEYFLWWFDVLKISHVFLNKAINYVTD